MTDDVHSTKIEISGHTPADLQTIEDHAEAIANALTANVELLSTYEEEA